MVIGSILLLLGALACYLRNRSSLPLVDFQVFNNEAAASTKTEPSG